MLDRRNFLRAGAAFPVLATASYGLAPVSAASISPDFAALIAIADNAHEAATTYGKDVHDANVRAATAALGNLWNRTFGEMEEANDRFGIRRSGQRSDELWAACCLAQSDVAAYPVSTAADLAAKLAFMVKHQMGDGMDWLEELHADARRVAKLGDPA
ncbi:MAG: hypothetical protein V3V60_17255 [Sphingomonas aquatilis]|jgi:hypothetical protein|uniref:hypothetical protein n=1 Tax=Sphingomonas aquatilis TaxID=93063 RepID=UPI002F333F3F